MFGNLKKSMFFTYLNIRSNTIFHREESSHKVGKITNDKGRTKALPLFNIVVEMQAIVIGKEKEIRQMPSAKKAIPFFNI